MKYCILACEIVLHLPMAYSLKDKRMVVRSVKDKLGNRWKASVIEAGSQDIWNQAELALALTCAGETSARDAAEAIRVFLEDILIGQGEVRDFHYEVL